MKTHSDSQGMALVLCLLMISTLCLIGGAALGVAGLNIKIVHNGTKQLQAFNMAEAGRGMAVAKLRQNPLWRGDEETTPSGLLGALPIGGGQGNFRVTLSDGTADENGVYDALLPAGHVMVKSVGTYLDAVQRVSCLIEISPGGRFPAAFPPKAVISAGEVTGPITTRNAFGSQNPSLLLSNTMLPEANTAALKALSTTAFSSLDNDAWDDNLDGIESFWLDPPANTLPRITYVREGLHISGDRRLFGIIFVTGSHIVLSGETCIQGVLYAPNAASITIGNDGTAGRPVVTGQLVAGPGGIQFVGNQVAVQVQHDYAEAFNEAAGSDTNIHMVPGSWARL